MACDPNALIVAALPLSGDAARDRGLLALACQRVTPDFSAAALVMPRERPERVFEAQLETLAELAGPGYGPLAQHLLNGGPPARQGVALLPWAVANGTVPAAARRHAFEASLADCRFRDAPWFAPVRAALETVFPRLEASGPALLAGRAAQGETADAAPWPTRRDDAALRARALP